MGLRKSIKGLLVCGLLIGSVGYYLAREDETVEKVGEEEVTQEKRVEFAETRPILTTAIDYGVKPQPLTEVDRNDVLEAAVTVAHSRRHTLHDPAFDDALQTLAKYGNTALVTIAHELHHDNDTLEPAAIERRLALIDLLGTAAKSNSVAKDLLFNYATRPLRAVKDDRLLHMDLADRLEAFSYLANVRHDDAGDFIKNLSNQQLKKEYSYTFYVGFRMAGLSHDHATQRVFDLTH